MTTISEIIDRLSVVEAVKERLRDTAARVEQWASRLLVLDSQVRDRDIARLQIETLDEVARTTRKLRHMH